MLDLRKKIFIIVSVVVALVLIFILLYFFVFNKEVKESVLPPSQPGVVVDQVTGQVIIPKVEPKAIITNELGESVEKDAAEAYAKQVSRIFTERFFTYSNQNNNQHIEDVITLATPLMQKWIKTQGVEEGSQYSGLTTRVIASSIEKIEENTATVLLDVQQTIRENGTEKVEYKSGKIDLIRSGGDWKVNGFYWN